MSKARAFVRAAISATLALMASSAVAGPPGRVVSMNLCTDQLAMLVAAPGQLHAVSRLARDPESSVMADQAQAYAVTHGLAEEIFLMQPDLVIAGTFTTPATVGMLRRLGFRVETFPPAASFDDIRANIRRMGAALGRQARAAALIKAFDKELAVAGPPHGATRGAPRAALYYQNSYTSGAGTLANEIVTASGLENVAAELGLEGMTRLPLEVLVMSHPELIISGRRFDPPALAGHGLEHPALRALDKARRAVVADKHWVCGAPFSAEAVRMLAKVRARLTPEQVAR